MFFQVLMLGCMKSFKVIACLKKSKVFFVILDRTVLPSNYFLFSFEYFNNGNKIRKDETIC